MTTHKIVSVNKCQQALLKYYFLHSRTLKNPNFSSAEPWWTFGKPILKNKLIVVHSNHFWHRLEYFFFKLINFMHKKNLAKIYRMYTSYHDGLYNRPCKRNYANNFTLSTPTLYYLFLFVDSCIIILYHQ